MQHRVKATHKTEAVLIRAAIVDVLGKGGHLSEVLESFDG